MRYFGGWGIIGGVLGDLGWACVGQCGMGCAIGGCGGRGVPGVGGHLSPARCFKLYQLHLLNFFLANFRGSIEHNHYILCQKNFFLVATNCPKIGIK